MKDKSKDKNRSESKKALVKSKQTVRIQGVSVRDVVLPWESKDEFDQLYQDLRAEFSPLGRMEEDTVLDLAILRWRKYQLLKMRRTAALKDPFFIELMESGKKSWSGVRKYLRAQDKAGKTISGAIRNALSELIDVANELAHEQKSKGMEKEEVERTEQKLSGIMKVVSEHVVPLIRAVDAGPSAEKTFEQAYMPEYLERVIKYEAALDARIDKLLGRLVNLKEYKRVYAAHMLPSPLIKSPSTVTELAELTADR
jgi:histone H3/H4